MSLICENKKEDDYVDSIQTHDPLQQRTVDAVVESSASDTSAIREILFGWFFKQVGHGPLIKDDNNFKYKNVIILFIKDRQKVKLNNVIYRITIPRSRENLVRRYKRPRVPSMK